MKNLPIGIKDFSKLRQGNCVYVDKTQYIHHLFTTGYAYYLSRPRQFGKTLLISTMEELFGGNKELFEGLFIYDKWDWEKKNPVIKFDFSNIVCASDEELQSCIADILKGQAKKFELDVEISDLMLSSSFSDLIRELHKKFNADIVVLVDEYDKAVLSNIQKPEVMRANRELLGNFFQVLKSNGKFIRSIFITGSAKFSSGSIFSGFNNVSDITFNSKSDSICGFTQEELESAFSEHISANAKKLQMNNQDLLDEIKRFYYGYSWNGEETVYNPFSTLKFLEGGKFRYFWSESGAPTFLIERIKNENQIEWILGDLSIDLNSFSRSDPDNCGDTLLLFQNGYLTVKGEERDEDYCTVFSVGMPNIETREVLMRDLFKAYAETSDDIAPIGVQMKKQILACDSAGFEKTLTSLLAKIPGKIKIKKQEYCHCLLLLAMGFLGFEMKGRVSTGKGSAYAVTEEKDWAAVAVLKYGLEGSADTLIKEAFNQIDEKKYYQPYLKKKIILLAVVYTPKGIKCEIKPLNK